MACKLCNSFKSSPFDRFKAPNHEKLNLSWPILLSSSQTCECCRILCNGIEGCLGQHQVAVDDILSLSFFFNFQRPNTVYNGVPIEYKSDCQKLITAALHNDRSLSIEFFTLPGVYATSSMHGRILTAHRRGLPMSRLLGRCSDNEKDDFKYKVRRSLHNGTRMVIPMRDELRVLRVPF